MDGIVEPDIVDNLPNKVGNQNEIDKVGGTPHEIGGTPFDIKSQKKCCQGQLMNDKTHKIKIEIQSKIRMSQEEFDKKFPITGNIKDYELFGFYNGRPLFKHLYYNYNGYSLWNATILFLILAVLSTIPIFFREAPLGKQLIAPIIFGTGCLLLAIWPFIMSVLEYYAEKSEETKPYELFYKDHNGQFYYNAQGQRVNYVKNDDNMKPMVSHDGKLCYILRFTEYCYTNSKNEIVDLGVSKIAADLDFAYYIRDGDKKRYISISELDKNNPNIEKEYIWHCYIKDEDRKIYLDPNITVHKTWYMYRYYFSNDGTRIELDNQVDTSCTFIRDKYEWIQV